MELDNHARLAVEDERGWVNGRPTERTLVALFAAMTCDHLERFVLSVLSRSLTEMGTLLNQDLGELRNLGFGQQALAVAESRYDFVGAEYYFDAVRAATESKRLHRSAVKNVALAIEAVEFAIGAVVDLRHHQEHPLSWEAQRAAIAEVETRGPSLPPPDTAAARRAYATAMWRIVLAEAPRV